MSPFMLDRYAVPPMHPQPAHLVHEVDGQCADREPAALRLALPRVVALEVRRGLTARRMSSADARRLSCSASDQVPSSA